MLSKHSNGFVRMMSINRQIRTSLQLLYFQMNLFEFHQNVQICYFRTTYTCALNHRGGVEAHFGVTVLESGDGSIVNPKFKV